MNFAKQSIALALAGAVTVAAATPSFARSWKPWAAAGAGFAAGAVVGAAAANSRAYYGPGYGGAGYYEPGYDSYAYSGGGYSGPAVEYETGPTVSYSQRYQGIGNKNSCATAGNYGRLDYSSC